MILPTLQTNQTFFSHNQVKTWLALRWL